MNRFNTKGNTSLNENQLLTKLDIIKTISKTISNASSNASSNANIIVTPKLINRNNYHDILLKLNTTPYGICKTHYGIEYIISVVSNQVYHISKLDFYTEPIKYNGTCVISAIKYKDEFIIRRVVVDNKIIEYKNVKAINDKNKKFGDLLQIKYSTYDELTQSNYKRKIAEYKKSFIEFSPIETPFFESEIYQWSASKIPILFLCRECPAFYDAPGIKVNRKNRENREKYLYILFLTVSADDKQFLGLKKLPFHNEMFADVRVAKDTGVGITAGEPMHFSPSTYPNAYLYYSELKLDKKYVSLIFDFKKRDWLFVEQFDKSDTQKYGDDFKITELNVWNSYRNPVVFKDLVIDIQKINESMYFVNDKNPMHEAPIKMNNFVKNWCIRNWCNAESNTISVIDIASGRGSDLMNYRNAGVKNLLFCEIDVDAVDDALDRKYRIHNNNNTSLNIFNADLNKKYKINLDAIRRDFGVDSVSNIFCFFALHYMNYNIAGLIGNLLESGGKFLYTAFDGDAVIKLLAENNGKWEVFEKGVKKYSIISVPKTRKIKLILPFNANTFYYEENLIDDKALDTHFKKNGLIVEKEGSFMEFEEEFKKKRFDMYKRLTSDEKIFIGLYKYKLYTKISSKLKN